AARRQQDRSILDSITRTLARFKVRIGAEDRVRVDEYLGDVREIERRLQIAAKASTEVPTTTPYGVPESFDEHIKLQFDLLALAFRADITRVSTLLYARDLTARVYPESGTTISFHGGSHHAEDPKRIAEYAKLNRYHVAMLAYFIDKLRSTIGTGAVALVVSAVAVGAARSDVADAVMKGDRAALRTLLQQRADVNAPQADGATALHWAVYRDDLEAAALLIQAGANVTA